MQAEETHNTLKFAARAKKVKITASRNKINDERSQIMMYQQQVVSLKQQLNELKAQAAMSTHSFSTVAAPVSVDDMHVRPDCILCRVASSSPCFPARGVKHDCFASSGSSSGQRAHATNTSQQGTTHREDSQLQYW